MEKTEILSVLGAAMSVSCSAGCSGKIRVVFQDSRFAAVETEWTITESGSYELASRISFSKKSGKLELFIPSVLYRKNNCGRGAFPKGGIERAFAFREERTPLPGCVVIRDGCDFTAFCISPASDPSETAHVCAYETENRVVIEMRLPPSEYPFSYCGKTRTVPHVSKNTYFRADDCSPEKPLVIRRVQFVFTTSVSELYANTLFSVYREFSSLVSEQKKINNFCCGENVFSKTQKTPVHADSACAAVERCSAVFESAVGAVPSAVSAHTSPRAVWDEWFSRKLAHLEFLTDAADDGSAFIRMGKGNGDLQSIYEFTAASFLVKSVEGAVVFAKSGNARLAEAIGRYFLRAEHPEKSGIYRDNYSIARDEWGGYLGVSEHSDYAKLINARCNGEAMSAYIELYEALLELGSRIDEFIELPKRVARFYLSHCVRDKEKADSGNFGRWRREDGKVVNGSGTNGAYIVIFLTALYPHADEELQKEIKTALALSGEYYHRMIRNADYYGDTLDADAFDKESAAVLLRESLDLYAFTGDTIFLEDAKAAANFAYTWMWQYDVRFPKGTPLDRLHFKTRGMTSVSVAHHHLDFYGMYIARDFLRLHALCGDPFYRDAALCMMRACLALVASEKEPLGKGAKFAGWQPEQINHTDWDYFDRKDHAQGYFDICIAWEAVLTLHSYVQIARENPSALNEAT